MLLMADDDDWILVKALISFITIKYWYIDGIELKYSTNLSVFSLAPDG